MASKQAKDTSVKKLLLLGVLPDCPESHANVKLLLDMVKLRQTEFVFSGDLKMCKKYCYSKIFVIFHCSGNIVTGKSMGRLTHDCCFCDSAIPYTKKGNLFTIGEIWSLLKVLYFFYYCA